MNRKLLIVGILLMIVVATASYCVVRRNAPPIAQRPEMIDGFPAWHRDSALPWTLDPALARYQGPKLFRALPFLDGAARRLAAPDWDVLAPAQYPFTDTRGKLKQDYARVYRARWHSGVKPTSPMDPRRWQREMNLRIELAEVRSQVEELWFNCELGKEGAWCVAWHCDLEEGSSPVGFIFFKFWHPEMLSDEQGKTMPASFMISSGRHQLPNPEGWTGDEHAVWEAVCYKYDPSAGRRRPEQVLRFWQSAESFEAAALEEFALVDRLIAGWFADAASLPIYGPYGGDGIPPMELPPPQLPLSKRVRVAVGATLINQAHRQQIQRYAPEMHRVLVESFPEMPELLKLFDTPRP